MSEEDPLAVKATGLNTLTALAGKVVEQHIEISSLKSLCARAADALAFWMYDLPSEAQAYDTQAITGSKLITELREAGK
jgi:hypothetical protein